MDFHVWCHSSKSDLYNGVFCYYYDQGALQYIHVYLFLVRQQINSRSITCTGTSTCCESLRGYDGCDGVIDRDGLPGALKRNGQKGEQGTEGP